MSTKLTILTYVGASVPHCVSLCEKD